MYRITLINMPFASLDLPSIALTQLKSVVEQRFGDDVRVRILYLNLEFAHYFGEDLHSYVTGALQASNSGLGDWIFRQLAFPDEPDNTSTYFQRYFPSLDAQGAAIKGKMLAKRAGLKRFFGRIIAKHQLDREDLVGLTSMFAQNAACFAMAREVKERNPKALTVIGGANCEAPMGEEIARHVDAIDLAFSGPGLVNFPEVVQADLDGDRDRCHTIGGVLSRQNVGSLRHAGHIVIGQELPIDIPVPLDYESFLTDLERSFPDGSVRPSLTFETSRGCWWGERSHCTFCGLNGGSMKYRAMPSEAALEMFEDLFTRYAGRCSRFESVDNIMPRQYIKEVFAKIVPPPGVSIFYEVKADLKEWEMEVLSQAGVDQIQPGIEALSTSTLKLMGKGTTSFQNIAFLKNCLQFGIRPIWNLLIGFPGEEEAVYESYLRAIPLLTHLPPPSGAFPVRFDRYSPYFTKASEYGLDLVPYAFYSAIYPFGDESLSRMAYYFEDRNYDADYLAKLVEWQDRLMAAVERWKQRRNGTDERPAAELRLDLGGDAPMVYDTRSGEVVRHPLSELEVELLCALRTKGLGASHLGKNREAGDQAISAALENLIELGLVFEENERFICLVMGIEGWEGDIVVREGSLFGSIDKKGLTEGVSLKG